MNDPCPPVVRWGVVAALGLVVAVVPGAGVHVLRVAVLGLAGMAVLPVLGWLRTLWFTPVAVAACAAWVTAQLLHVGQAVPIAALIATVCGVAAGALSGIVVQWVSAAARPWLSLGLAVGTWAIVLPRLDSAPSPPPLLFGIDLSGERSLAVVALVLLGLGVTILGHLSRSRVGRQIGAAGSSPTLALRSGATMPKVWLRAGIVSGVLAAWAGLLLTLDVQAMPPAAQFSPAAALAWLAVPLVGGPAWVSGVLVGATLIGGLAATGVPEPAVAGVAFVVAAMSGGSGIVGGLAQRWDAR